MAAGMVVLILAVLAPQGALCQRFRAEGRLTYTAAARGGNRTNVVTRDFVFWRNDGQWKARTIPVQTRAAMSTANSPVLFYEAGSDGTNMFYLEQDNIEELRRRLGARTVDDTNFMIAQASVELGIFPQANAQLDLINCAWQAYASAPYYLASTNGRAMSPMFVFPGYYRPQQMATSTHSHQTLIS